MSIINHKLLTQRALPVASQAMSAWVISRSLMEEDFAPEEDSAEASVTTLPPIIVLAVITVEPVTGRVMLFLGQWLNYTRDAGHRVWKPLMSTIQCKNFH